MGVSRENTQGGTMEYRYTLTDGVIDERKYWGTDDRLDELWDEVQLNDWHINSWDDEPLQTVVCKGCGGKEFNVGREYLCTTIRCVKCRWEKCIHSD